MIFKKILSAFISLVLLATSSNVLAAGVCDEFIAPEIQAQVKAVSDNQHGSCILEKEALKYVDGVYIGESSEGDVQFSLYETADTEYGLFVVDSSYFDASGEIQPQIIPLAVVLTAVAIDFGLIAGMYGVYFSLYH